MGQKTLKSPTGGVISVVHKAVGERIDEDEEVLVIECMKMEIPLAASAAGTIVKLDAKAGDAVVEDQVLVVIESP